MNRKIVTKTDVYTAANFIASSGEVPTIAAVRGAMGGRGSETTILTHLQTWKKERLLQSQGIVVLEGNTTLETAEETRQLRLALKQQMDHNENYAEELINAEKELAKLKAENQELQTSNQQLQEKLLEVTNLKDLLATLCHELKTNFSNDLEKVINDKNKLIGELQQEIRDLNQVSIQMVRQTSSDGHDALMQEKVKVLNLEEKVGQIQRQLEKQKNEVITMQKPLLHQLAWHKKIIADLIDPEVLKIYEKEQSQEVIR